jgi:hypothetical protein
MNRPGEADRARDLLTDPATGPAILDRVAAWEPVTAEVRAQLEQLLQDGQGAS